MLTKKISVARISKLFPNSKALLISAITILSLASFYDLNAQKAGNNSVIFYEHANYEGGKMNYGGGSFEEPQLSRTNDGDWNDRISSISVGKGVHLTIYSDKGYGSQSVDLYAGDYPTLPCEWGDAISSFKIDLIDENAPIITLWMDDYKGNDAKRQYISLGEYEQRISQSDRDAGQQGLFCHDDLYWVDIPEDGLKVTVTGDADGNGRKTSLKKGSNSLNAFSLDESASWLKVEQSGWEEYDSKVETISSITQPSESIASNSTGRNNSDLTQEMEVNISTEYGQEYTSKWENSTLVGVEIQTKVGIPKLGETSVTGKVENTFTIGREQTGTVTKKFEYNQKTYVAPGTETFGTVIVTPKLITYKITHKLRNKDNPKETREEVQTVVVKDASEAKFQWDKRKDSEDVNLALNKRASQSTDFDAVQLPASRAVDGIMTGTGEDFSHTVDGEDGWWEVDLGQVYDISKIVIWNRTDECCWSRLQNFYVMVSETPIRSNSVSSRTLFSGPHSFTDATHPSMLLEGNKSGRYVRIFLNNGTNPLNLAEVEVFGK